MYEEEKLIERTISSEITDKWFATSHGSQWRERTTETASAFPQAASDIKTVLNRWTTVRMKYAGKKSCRLAARN